MTDIEETPEEMTRRLAQNRYDIRQFHKWRLSDGPSEDCTEAERIIRDTLAMSRLNVHR
jgi:hypothetical protein